MSSNRGRGQLGRVPSLHSGSGSMSPVQTPSSSQPRYTTAGTIWNPEASQPLQPPTRRGRAVNYNAPAPGGGPDSSLLPRSSISGAFSSPQDRYADASHSRLDYHPLQQNYDRAQSPPANHRASSGPMGYSNPTVRSGNSQDARLDMRQGSSATVADGKDGRNSSLQYLPSKAIKNLTTYENPNREVAVRRWFDAFQTVDASEGPSREAGGRFQMSPRNDVASPIGNRLRFESPAPNLGGRPGGGSEIHHPTPTYAPGRRQVTDLLASGPGAPAPLAAGPPGRRGFYRAPSMAHRRRFDGDQPSYLPVTQRGYSLQQLEGRVPAARGISPSELSQLAAGSEPDVPGPPAGVIAPPSQSSRSPRTALSFNAGKSKASRGYDRAVSEAAHLAQHIPYSEYSARLGPSYSELQKIKHADRVKKIDENWSACRRPFEDTDVLELACGSLERILLKNEVDLSEEEEAGPAHGTA